jgi:hypothetical protein
MIYGGLIALFWPNRTNPAISISPIHRPGMAKEIRKKWEKEKDGGGIQKRQMKGSCGELKIRCTMGKSGRRRQW